MTYATPSQYARLCKVHRSAIHFRIKSGALKTVERRDLTGKIVNVINLKEYPPRKFKVGRPKTVTKK